MFTKVKELLVDTFNLKTDCASMEEISERIRSGGTIKVTNICILVLAMFIASIGLNMNSPAVIIGAMLISPLMGGIMSIAYGIATLDMNYAKNSFFGLFFEMVFCVLVSTIYFTISPITTASSELLARTSPTIWDVLIACFGGLAGIIGTTREEKTNVIPGVAIATALMPPLCTAGFGIARGSLDYFLGALYLFFINSFFICLTSVIVLKILGVPAKEYVSKKVLRRQKIYAVIIIVVTVLPSVYMGYKIVKENIRTSSINNYVASEFDFADTQVVSSKLNTAVGELEIAVIGKRLDTDTIQGLKDAMTDYGLSGIDLRVTQTEYVSGISKEDVESIINTTITNQADEGDTDEEAQKTAEIEKQLETYKGAYFDRIRNEALQASIADELESIYPYISSVKGSTLMEINEQFEAEYSTYAVALATTAPLSDADKEQIKKLVAYDTGCKEVVIIETAAVPELTKAPDTVSENEIQMTP